MESIFSRCLFDPRGRLLNCSRPRPGIVTYPDKGSANRPLLNPSWLYSDIRRSLPGTCFYDMDKKPLDSLKEISYDAIDGAHICI